MQVSFTIRSTEPPNFQFSYCVIHVMRIENNYFAKGMPVIQIIRSET